MVILPDILAPNLSVVFCGTAVADASALRGHYYAGRGNKFWEFLHASGLTTELLRPEDDVRLPSFGIGLTRQNSPPTEAGGEFLFIEFMDFDGNRRGWIRFHPQLHMHPRNHRKLSE